jgi:hypothetical protein
MENSSSPDEISILRMTVGKFLSVGVRISGHSVIAYDKSPLQVMLVTQTGEAQFSQEGLESRL